MRCTFLSAKVVRPERLRAYRGLLCLLFLRECEVPTRSAAKSSVRNQGQCGLTERPADGAKAGFAAVTGRAPVGSNVELECSFFGGCSQYGWIFGLVLGFFEPEYLGIYVHCSTCHDRTGLGRLHDSTGLGS